MKNRPNHIAWILLPLAGAFLATTPSQAVETTGAPGSPSATTTIPGNTWILKGFQMGLKPEYTYNEFVAGGQDQFKKLPEG